MTLTLEERIRELCSQAVAVDDAQELNRILGELKLALHEHTERLRAMLSLYPILSADLVKTRALNPIASNKREVALA